MLSLEAHQRPTDRQEPDRVLPVWELGKPTSPSLLIVVDQLEEQLLRHERPVRVAHVPHLGSGSGTDEALIKNYFLRLYGYPPFGKPDIVYNKICPDILDSWQPLRMDPRLRDDSPARECLQATPYARSKHLTLAHLPLNLQPQIDILPNTCRNRQVIAS